MEQVPKSETCALNHIEFINLQSQWDRVSFLPNDKMIAPVLLMGKGLLPPRKAKHGVGSCWSESFK
jgi:hypothetical protein